MNEPPTLDQTRDQVWQMLTDGVAHSTAPARHLVLATVDADGAPQARLIVLRGADPVAGILEVHTDALSHKVSELRHTPNVALQVWSAQDLVQLRLSGTAKVQTGAAVADRWGRVPDASRVAYAHVPAPGTPIADSGDFAFKPSPARFAVITVRLHRIESVSLDPGGHRRARFDLADDWRGCWLSP